MVTVGQWEVDEVGAVSMAWLSVSQSVTHSLSVSQSVTVTVSRSVGQSE